MLKNDFNSSLKFLFHDLVTFNNFELDKQEKYLDSEKYDNAFEKVETSLDRLYEKTRVLEDIIAYTKDFLEQTVIEYESECNDLLKAIESKRDDLKTRSYITIDVPFKESLTTYIDRNEIRINDAAIYDKKVTIKEGKKEEVNIDNFTVKRNNVNYEDNIEELNNSPYRTYYLLDEPAKAGVKEDLTANMKDGGTINSIEIKNTNCIVANVKYNLKNGSIEYEDDVQRLYYSKTRDVKSIDASIIAKQIRPVTYEVDTLRMDKNFWDEVKEFEYSDAMNKGAIKPDFETLSGMKAYKEAYEQYQKDLKWWEENRYYYKTVSYTETITETVQDRPHIVGNSVDVGNAQNIFGDNADYTIVGDAV